jgi:hypothetical protein
MRSQLNQIRKQIERLREKASDTVVRFKLKDGNLASIAVAELRDPYSLFGCWVFNNASPDYRASDGSKLHTLTQMVQGTLDTPFVSWEEFRDRCPAIADEDAATLS